MARRSSLNKRSSRSSRHTGSGVLDPNTDVVDNTYPYWWENLENNTVMRSSVGYGALNETSPQLDSNSQVETGEAKDGWWKILETSDSSKHIKSNTKKGTSKHAVLTSDSEEEEPKIRKKKLPLQSKAKTHENNAFFNILNDWENAPMSSPVHKAREKSSANNFDTNNEVTTNKKQLTEMHDSSSNQSSSSNNILKPKPKIFRKVNKEINQNLFVDVLQNSQFKVPLPKRASINEQQKNFSIVQAPVDNQSETTECTLSFESTNDYSHFPAPKAQSTIIEDSTSNNSNKNDSSSDIEPKVVKRKPKVFKRPTRSINKNVFTKVFITEEDEDEVEKSTLQSKSNEENTKIPKRSLLNSPNDSSKISQRLQKNVINEDEDIDISRSRKRRKSTILAERTIKKFSKNFIGENIVIDKTESSDSIASDNIPVHPRVSLTSERKNLKEATNMNVNSRTQSLNSLDNNMKEKNAQRRSTLDENVISDKNVSEVFEDVVRHPNDELQSVYEEQEKIPQERSIPNLNRLSHRTSNLTSSMKEHKNVNVITTNVNAKDGKEADKDISTDSSDDEIRDPTFELNFTKKQSGIVKNSSRSSFRNSRVTSSVRRVKDTDANTSNVEDLNDINNEETVNQLPYVDENTSALRSKFSNVSSSNKKEHNDANNHSRLPHRVSNVELSTNKVKDKDTNTLNINKNVREEENKDSSESSDEDLAHRFRRLSQRRSVANISSSNNRKEHSSTGNRGRVSSRSNNLQLSAKEIIQTNSSNPNVGVKDIRGAEDEALCTVNYEETPKSSQYANKEQQNISQKRFVANISSRINRKEHSNAANRSRLSHRVSNVVSSKVQMNTEVPDIGDKGIGEVEKDSSNEEVPNGSQHPDKNTNLLQRKSGASISSRINRKEHSNTANRSRLSPRVSNLVSSKVQMNTEVPDISDKGIGEVEEDSSNEEAPNGSQHNALKRKEQDNVKSQSRAGIASSFLKTPTNRHDLKGRSQMFITNFFSGDQSPSNLKKRLFVDKQRVEEMKKTMQKVMEKMANNASTSSKQCEPKPSVERNNINKKQSVKQKKKKIVPKKVNKAYLVNGNVYRVPRLPRPKSWVTDHLYNHLWKVMKPKFELETRVASEKFILQLCEITDTIAKQKSYENYKDKLFALMKEMARLGIVRTRFDFYQFCHDFFPYDLILKMVPMLLPGNKRNVPYNPSKLHEPLLNS